MAKAIHKGGLGKGLADLFSDGLEEPSTETNSISTIAMAMVEPNQNQPRKEFNAEALAQLTESIRMHGVVTPITVRKQENGYYQIIAGERRWRAAREAGLTEIPALVLEVTDVEMMGLALIENLQRQDLNAIEEAEGYQALMQQYGFTQDQVAERVGKSRSAVANALRLLSLDQQTRELVEQGEISSGHARAVLSIHDEKLRADAAKKMAQMSVRQAEGFAKRLNKTEKEKSSTSASTQVDYVAELERELESRLGRRVKIAFGKTHGTLSLEFYGNDDLERLREGLQNLQA